MSDPLASLRSKLANGPHVVTSVATPRATSTPTSSKTDPLAALRAQIKAGKIKTAPKPAPAPVGIRGVPLR